MVCLCLSSTACYSPRFSSYSPRTCLDQASVERRVPRPSVSNFLELSVKRSAAVGGFELPSVDVCEDNNYQYDQVNNRKAKRQQLRPRRVLPVTTTHPVVAAFVHSITRSRVNSRHKIGIGRSLGFTLLACLAYRKVMFDRTGLIADDLDDVQQRLFGDREFRRPPRHVPMLSDVYDVPLVTRQGLYVCTPTVTWYEAPA